MALSCTQNEQQGLRCFPYLRFGVEKTRIDPEKTDGGGATLFHSRKGSHRLTSYLLPSAPCLVWWTITHVLPDSVSSKKV